MILLLLFLSIAPVAFFGYQIYKRDFDKEPTTLLVKLFFSGVGSTIVTLIITAIISSIIPFFGYDSEKLNIIQLIPYVFIGVALVEEFSKWIFVYLLEYNDKEFNHLYDGIVYAAFVALGFACFENILYVMQYGIVTAITRAFLAIPGHLCDGIMMGYYLSLAKLASINGAKDISKKNLILSLLVPTLAHGIYDYLLFANSVSGNGLFMLLFFAFVILFFAYAYKQVKKMSVNYYNLNPNYIPEHLRQNYQGYMQTPGYPHNAPVNNQMYNNQMYNQPVMNNNYGYSNQNNQVMNNNQMQTGYNSQVMNNYPNQNMNVGHTTYCQNCGQTVNGNFCTNCGRKI